MITEPVLIDTGPLVAMLNERDSRHEICRQQSREIGGDVFTSWPVITEAAWLLRTLPDGLVRLLQVFRDRDIQLLPFDEGGIDWLMRYADQYRDLHPQLADISLIYLAQRYQIRHVFTLDRRDFSVYRLPDNEVLQLLPQELS